MKVVLGVLGSGFVVLGRGVHDDGCDALIADISVDLIVDVGVASRL